ncbi:MAG TPA: NAD-glutamate dehydrogenase, partial [Propionibacteriaceae bacterium]|nr:NAD-glutamate dehydrogenase [Propionibacteriaceae bacterium]
MSYASPADETRVPRVAERLDLPPGSPVEDRGRLVATYLEHQHGDDLDDIGADDLAAIISAHVGLAARREPGTDSVVVASPEDAGGPHLSGSSLLQVVTDDRPFLVDSVTIEVTRQRWSIRHVFHPQLVVTRDGHGDLVAVGSEAGVPESWMTLVVYPPLGVAADEVADALVSGVRDVLVEVRRATDDWGAMRDRMTESVDLLGTSPYIAREDGEAARDLLRWLRDDNFTFLGYREYTYDGDAYSPVAGTGLGVLRAGEDGFHALPGHADDAVLVFTKDSVRSRVHRAVYRDYVGLRVLDARGAIVGERRFVGVLASPAYTEPVTRIPILIPKATEILRRSGYSPQSHGYKALLATLNAYPRDALLHAGADELYPIVERIASLGERRQVRVFCHRDRWDRFVNCLVYLPRDRYTTATAERIQQILADRFGGGAVDHSALVTESVMTRLDIVVQLSDGSRSDVDLDALEDDLTEATRTWDERFIDHVYSWPSELRGVDFPDSYKDVFTPQQGVADLELLNSLDGTDEMRAAILDTEADDAADLRLRLYRRSRLALPDVLPHLDSLGVSVIDEWPFELTLRDEPAWVYEFGLLSDASSWDAEGRERFIDAFQASVTGRLEVGPMNALVTVAGLTWEEVGRLRAMERYLKQGGMPYSSAYIASALQAHPSLARNLVAAFRAAHDPEQPGAPEEQRDAAETLLASVEAELDQVAT